MAVEQAGEDSHPRKVDHVRLRRYRDIRADRLDLSVLNENPLIFRGGTGFGSTSFPALTTVI